VFTARYELKYCMWVGWICLWRVNPSLTSSCLFPVCDNMPTIFFGKTVNLFKSVCFRNHSFEFPAVTRLDMEKHPFFHGRYMRTVQSAQTVFCYMHKHCETRIFKFAFEVEHKLGLASRFLTTLIFELPRFLLVVSSFYNPHVSEFVISALLIWLLDGPKIFAQVQSIEIESFRVRQKIRFCWHSICPWDRSEVISYSGSYCFADY